jgi:hypothetical protein
MYNNKYTIMINGDLGSDISIWMHFVSVCNCMCYDLSVIVCVMICL